MPAPGIRPRRVSYCLSACHSCPLIHTCTIILRVLDSVCMSPIWFTVMPRFMARCSIKSHQPLLLILLMRVCLQFSLLAIPFLLPLRFCAFNIGSDDGVVPMHVLLYWFGTTITHLMADSFWTFSKIPRNILSYIPILEIFYKKHSRIASSGITRSLVILNNKN